MRISEIRNTQQFQDLCQLLLVAEYGDTKIVRDSSGDGGMDAYVPSTRTIYAVYCPEVSPTPREYYQKKIRADLAKAVNLRDQAGYNVEHWVFITPEPVEETLHRYIQTKAVDSGFTTGTNQSETHLVNLLARHGHLRSQFPNLIVADVESSLRELNEGITALASQIESNTQESDLNEKISQILLAMHSSNTRIVEEEPLDYVCLPNLEVTVYDREAEANIVLQALEVRQPRKVWLVVAPSTFGKTFLVIKILQRLTREQYPHLNVKKVLYVDCRNNRLVQVIEDFGRLLGKTEYLRKKFVERTDERLDNWMSKYVYEPLQRIGTTLLVLDNLEAWLDPKSNYTFRRYISNPAENEEFEDFILTFFQREHDIRVLLLSQSQPAMKSTFSLSELDSVGEALVQGLPKTEEVDFALNYLMTEGAEVGLDSSNAEQQLDFIHHVERNPMALASLVGYLQTVRGAYTFDELVQRKNLFVEIDRYEQVVDRTKYLIKRQIASQSPHLQRVLCALAFFGRPVPRQALEVFLPRRVHHQIARLVKHKLANSTVGPRGTYRYELHSLFFEVVRSGALYHSFCASLTPTLVAALIAKSDVESRAAFYQRAIDLLECALSVSKYINEHTPTVDQAMIYLNRGIAQNGLRQRTKAISSYEQAIAICVQLTAEEEKSKIESFNKLMHVLALAYMNKGNALNDGGHPEESISLYAQAIETCTRLSSIGYDVNGVLSLASMNKANALFRLNSNSEALAAYDQAIEICNKAGLYAELAMTYRNKGDLLRLLKRHGEAEQLYDCAIALRKQLINRGYDRIETVDQLAVVYIAKGDLLAELGRLEAANEEYEQGLKIYEELIRGGREELILDLVGMFLSKTTVLLKQSRITDATLVYKTFIDQYGPLIHKLVGPEMLVELDQWWTQQSKAATAM